MASTIEIFFSYSHKDEALREQLEKQLSLLKWQGVISGWHDRNIIAGQEWANEIDKHLNAAQIILLLISPDFMASNYCYGIEVKRAMERHERGEARVIPVILRPVYWEGAQFGKLQALPTNAKPITRWGNRDSAFLEVAEGIVEAIGYILERSSLKVSERIVENEILTTVRVRPTILRNPFDLSRPASRKMFFGRAQEMQIMRRELCERAVGQALVLYGPRRSGKSSLAKNFLEFQVDFPFWSVLFSLQNAARQTEETILKQLAEKVCIEFEEQLQRPAPNWEQYKQSDPQKRFRNVLQDCIAQVPGTRLVLALDEFGGALDSYERQILDFRFFLFWRALMSEIPQLSLIFVLPTSAYSLLSSRKFATVFSFAQPLAILYLDTESAKQLLIDPFREQYIAFHLDTVMLALKLTGYSPYYINLVGQQLIHYLNQKPHQQLIADADLLTVIDQLIEKGASPAFSFLRRELQNEDELAILEAMIEVASHTKQSEIQLKKIAAQLSLPIPAVRRHMDRLHNSLILQSHGPLSNLYYSFTIELVRRWLMHNRWFFSPDKPF